MVGIVIALRPYVSSNESYFIEEFRAIM